MVLIQIGLGSTLVAVFAIKNVLKKLRSKWKIARLLRSLNFGVKFVTIYTNRDTQNIKKERLFAFEIQNAVKALDW